MAYCVNLRLFTSDNFKLFKSLEVNKFLPKYWIKWLFILEDSPWWRRFYELFTAIVKSSLKKVEGKALLNEKEMITIVKKKKVV